MLRVPPNPHSKPTGRGFYRLSVNHEIHVGMIHVPQIEDTIFTHRKLMGTSISKSNNFKRIQILSVWCAPLVTSKITVDLEIEIPIKFLWASTKIYKSIVIYGYYYNRIRILYTEHCPLKHY